MATKTIPQLQAAAALDDATLFEVAQGGLSRKMTGAQIKVFIQSNSSGEPGKSVELQKSATHIQWRNVGDAEWIDLVDLDDITGGGASNAVLLTGDQNIGGKKKFTAPCALEGGLLMPSLFKHTAPASGDTVSIKPGIPTQVVPMAASLAALTLRLPDWPETGFDLTISLPKAVTALTVTPGAGGTGTALLAGAPASTSGPAALHFRYFGDDGTWYLC